MKNTYIPKVLVAGNLDEFRANLVEAHTAEIIGNISFEGKFHNKEYSILNDNTLTIDGKFLKINKLRELAEKNTFDYIVFQSYSDCLKFCEYLSKNVVDGTQIITSDFFFNKIKKGFYSFRNQYLLYNILAQKGTVSLLDFDSFFAESQFFLRPGSLSQVVIDGFTQPKYPIVRSFYNNTYNSLKDCQFRHYDTILLTAERSESDLRNVIKMTQKMTNEYLIFNRKSAETVRNLLNDKIFSSVQGINCINGTWFIINNRKNENLSIFVVTHKKYPLDNLPKGYIPIHAGRELSEDLGYIGDNRGDNISKLNPYLNELTALYWIWKNSSNDYVGIAHYRRFFSNQNSYIFSTESILTPQQAYELLQHYDMIVGVEGLNCNTQNALIRVVDSGGDPELAERVLDIVEKMLKRYQPNYVDTFHEVQCGQGMFYGNMFITRKYIFDAFCEWLFSFVLPATDEFLRVIPVDSLTVQRKRILGFWIERMETVWILNQNLRLKDFPIMVNK